MSYRSNYLKTKLYGQKAVRRQRSKVKRRNLPSRDRSVRDPAAAPCSNLELPLTSNDNLGESSESFASVPEAPAPLMNQQVHAEGDRFDDPGSHPGHHTNASETKTLLINIGSPRPQGSQSMIRRLARQTQAPPKSKAFSDGNPANLQTMDKADEAPKAGQSIAYSADRLVRHPVQSGAGENKPKPPGGASWSNAPRSTQPNSNGSGSLVATTLPGNTPEGKTRVSETANISRIPRPSPSVASNNESSPRCTLPSGTTEKQTTVPDRVTPAPTKTTKPVLCGKDAPGIRSLKSSATESRVLREVEGTPPIKTQCSRVTEANKGQPLASPSASKVSSVSSGNSSNVTVQNRASPRSAQKQVVNQSTAVKPLPKPAKTPVPDTRILKPVSPKNGPVARRADTPEPSRIPISVSKLSSNIPRTPTPVNTRPVSATPVSTTRVSTPERVKNLPKSNPRLAVKAPAYRATALRRPPLHLNQTKKKCNSATSPSNTRAVKSVPPLALAEIPSNTSMLSSSIDSPASTRNTRLMTSPFAMNPQSPVSLMNLVPSSDLLHPWILNLTRTFSPTNCSEDLSLTDDTDTQSNASDFYQQAKCFLNTYPDPQMMYSASRSELPIREVKSRRSEVKHNYRAGTPDLSSVSSRQSRPGDTRTRYRPKFTLQGVGRSESFDVRLRSRPVAKRPNSEVQALSSSDISSSAQVTPRKTHMERCNRNSSVVHRNSGVEMSEVKLSETTGRNSPMERNRRIPPVAKKKAATLSKPSGKSCSLETIPSQFAVYNVFSFISVASDDSKPVEISPPVFKTAMVGCTENEFISCSVREKTVCLAPPAVESTRMTSNDLQLSKPSEAKQENNMTITNYHPCIQERGFFSIRNEGKPDFSRSVCGKEECSSSLCSRSSPAEEDTTSSDDDALPINESSVTTVTTEDEELAPETRIYQMASSTPDVRMFTDIINTGSTTPPVNSDLVVKVAEVRFCAEPRNSVVEIPSLTDHGEHQLITVTEYKDSMIGFRQMANAISPKEILQAEVTTSAKKTRIPVMKVVSVVPTVVISAANMKTEEEQLKSKMIDSSEVEKTCSVGGGVPLKKKELGYHVVDVTFTDLDKNKFAIQRVKEPEIKCGRKFSGTRSEESRSRKKSSATKKSSDATTKSSPQKSKKAASSESPARNILNLTGKNTVQTLLELLQSELSKHGLGELRRSRKGSSDSSEHKSRRHIRSSVSGIPDSLDAAVARSAPAMDLASHSASANTTRNNGSTKEDDSETVGPFPLGSSVTQIFTKKRRDSSKRRGTNAIGIDRRSSEWSTALFAKTLYFNEETGKEKRKRTKNKSGKGDDVKATGSHGRQSVSRCTELQTVSSLVLSRLQRELSVR